MSFFSKLGKELDGLFDGDKDKKKDKESKEPKADTVEEHAPVHEDAQRGMIFLLLYVLYMLNLGARVLPDNGLTPLLLAMNPSQQYVQPSYGYSNQSQQPPAPNYGYPPQQQHSVFPPGGPSPGPGYSAQQQPTYGAPPQGVTLPAIPQVPQGWLPLFEPISQRWAFLDQNSDKVDWNYPTNASYPVASHDGTRGFDDNRGAQSQGYYGGGGHDQYGGHGGYYDDGHGEKKDKDGKEKKDKKKSDNSGMMLGAAAGVGAGVVGGVLLASALGMHAL